MLLFLCEMFLHWYQQLQYFGLKNSTYIFILNFKRSEWDIWMTIVGYLR